LSSGAEWRYVGKPVKRKEDLRVLLATTKYIEDIQLPGLVHLGFYRSPFAHAKVRSIDVSQLREDSQTLAYVTGKDLSTETRPMPFITAPQGCLRPAIYPLATDTVRYVGEPIVAVVVSDGYSLQDSLEKVDVEFEILQPIRNIDEALSGATRLYEDWQNNVAFRSVLEYGNPAKAFGEAHFLISEKFELSRLYGAAIENRGVLAEYDAADDFLTLRSSTQWPHFVSRLLSETIGHPETKLRVIAPDVGGGFGNKQDFYREEVVVAQMAKKLRRPVKWIPSRREDMSSTVHSRDQVHHADLALSRDGRILGIRDKIYADLGAYGPMSIGPATTTFVSMTGPYEIENLRLEMECLVTSRVPIGAYRGFGQPEATFVLERLLDIAGEELRLDKAEIRRRNLVTKFPYTTATGRVLDSGNYSLMLQRGLELAGYKSHGTSANRRSTERMGVGLAFGFEGGGIGPSRIQDMVGARHKGFDSINLRITADGEVTIYTVLSPHGQGVETTFYFTADEAEEVATEMMHAVESVRRALPRGDES
jgi:carbon-monoxide dehydrogenase large subunit